ncbi:7-carboxy-7-deazaguanine synthase [Acidicapsa dinghuensis]|uniref:7-carboxy-7-deazaguanine synthase n=1 Tax=Acidicapsa dinghuensis TaxID=2218256 RepID=A0ABW1EI03_9BACT|nr:7-carboxy-7-deazaguanine synthase [Acidicapsa dinghuensis]
MSYSIKEIFYTLQGEGAQAGRPAVFCRFAGCNLWSGRESDRASAICRFCDTDFIGADGPDGGRFASPEDLAAAVNAAWTGGASNNRRARKFVVCTGGEPLLQLDVKLIDALHAYGFEIAVETNGTIAVPEGVDWVCVSPKAGAELVQTRGDELKFVFPQCGFNPEQLKNLEFHHFFLQPMDGPERESNTQLAVRYCMEHPQWRLSLQTHKLLGIR